MSILAAPSAVTSIFTNLTTRLAKPYDYRLNGICCRTLSATGSTTEVASVSLQTSNRRDALEAPERLTGLVR